MIATLRTLGLAIAAVGIWGAIIPYVGPLFGYPMPPGADVSAWHWTTDNWQLHLVPGLVAMVGGIMLTAGRGAGLGSFLALISGAWFVVGNEFARAWLPIGGGPQGDVGVWTVIATILGYHDGAGIIIAGLAAIALGIVAGARMVARAEPGYQVERMPQPAAERRRAAS